MSQYHLLSDQRITCPAIRSEMYKELISYANAGKNVIRHSIKQDEAKRADLAAFRVYKTEVLRWLVCLLSGCDDEADELPVGQEIKLPPANIVRDSIRRHEALSHAD